jgi:hypothetical protein
MHLSNFLAQSNNTGSSIAGMFVGLIELALAILAIAGIWKVFAKAGHLGWACLIPIYNIYILLKIAGRPGWWLLLFLIPLVNLAMAIVVSIDVARRFGKGVGFGFGLAFLGFVFYPILGFGDAQYTQPGSETRGFPVIPTAS